MNKTNANIYPQTKYVKLRYQRKCDTCHKTILNGERALKVTGRLWGYWFNETYCINGCDLKFIETRTDKEELLKLRTTYFSALKPSTKGEAK